jgi:hypothetical protein
MHTKFLLFLTFCTPFLCATGQTPASTLSRAELLNKVRGMLIGSAIGDAMGAPTEMWSREYIQQEYGFVDHLDSMVREPSAEGTWLLNLPAGGTTDDTRWKKLMVQYLLSLGGKAELDAPKFAGHLVQQYEQAVQALKNTAGSNPAAFEDKSRRMAWLQEWAAVARPFAAGKYLEYNDALSRFYGGEMVCGGLLYAPAAGAFFPGDANKAYHETFKICIFDLGYARDLSALIAAMTARAMSKDANPNHLLAVFRDVDPQGYFNSRLVGRSAYRILREANQIVFEANKLQWKDVDSTRLPRPQFLKVDALYLSRMQKAFELLDAKNQDMPFHAGEITLQVLTAMIFADFDFEKALVFLINFGRDNDTTGAVLGGILGAYWGADHLPARLVEPVLRVNKTLLDTDLEQLAQQLTDKIYQRYQP